MTAVLIPAATEEEWLAARRKGVTASEIAVLMGLSPYSSPYALYHQKTGDLPEPPDNAAMSLGRHMESWVADQFAQRHPEFHIHGDGRALFKHTGRDWQMATPDRVLYEHGIDIYGGRYGAGPPVAVLECKVDNGDGFGDDGTDEIPVHYRCQVLWQMDALGVTAGYLACLIWHRRQVRVYELAMDHVAELDVLVMRGEAVRFLERIDRKDPPGVDWRPATTAALKRLHPSVEDRDVNIGSQLAGRYRAACRNLKTAEQKKAKYENQVRELLGSARRATAASEVVVRRDVYDVAAKTIERKAFTVDKLVPVKPKEAKP